MRVVLISTYELGRQPFGLASPAAWLRAEGHEVTAVDVSRQPLPKSVVESADGIAFFLPMHTATRLALPLVERLRAANPRAALCGYGLYAPLNESLLREAGVETVIGGEFEEGLIEWARGQSPEHISLKRQQFRVPDRTGLPPFNAYARLVTIGGPKSVGYTEASRGCKHLCRHCPVVPVYRGTFRIVQPEVVLKDVRQQVAAGAEHITFGDPDFLNGPGHAITVVEALHREWPGLTYDITVKIEHLLKHRDLLPVLRQTGCVLVVSAVESLDDAVLERLAKGHTRADFLEALRLTRSAELPLSPTFIPFHPWTTLDGYRAFLRELVELGLAEQVAPVQLAIRLLIPEGSLLLDLPEIRALVEPFDARALCYPWRSELDGLASAVQAYISGEDKRNATRREIFRGIWGLAGGRELPAFPAANAPVAPHLTEPWYCCAEPTEEQAGLV